MNTSSIAGIVGPAPLPIAMTDAARSSRSAGEIAGGGFAPRARPPQPARGDPPTARLLWPPAGRWPAEQQAIRARGFHGLDGGGGGGRFGLAVFHQLDGLQQAHAAHFADDRVLLLKLFEAAAQVGAGLGAVGGQAVVLDVIDEIGRAS